MPSNKKKGSKKKKNSSAKGKQTAAAADRGGNELPPKRHTDEVLFGLGHESYLGECSICMIPLPLDESQCSSMQCCMNIICNGCAVASQLADKKAGRVVTCAFCREPTPKNDMSRDRKIIAQVQKRVEAGDALAHYQLGHFRVKGQHGLPKNAAKGIELWKMAAKLGSVHAHYSLADKYRDGDWGVKKDTEKILYHYEVAAIGGHFLARHNLGVFEGKEERVDRALRHWMISAKMGYEDSLKNILKLHKMGCATKDDYAQALLGYQKATEEMRSEERGEAKVYFRHRTG